MSVIFGELLTFGQDNGPEVKLVVFGDEHYGRHETQDGYRVLYDPEKGLFCYATLVGGQLVSTGISLSNDPPAGLRKHLRESRETRERKIRARRRAMVPAPPLHAPAETMLTLGPNQGLLPGRRLSVGSVRGLTILVEFQDVRSTVTAADVNEMLNGQNYTGNGNFSSAREYFRLVSNGNLDYTNDVVGPFRLSQNRSYYVNQLLVEEALDLAVAGGVDLTRYDSRREGIIDALNILYAGQTQYLGNLWPHNSGIDVRRGSMRTNLYLLTSLGASTADLSIGTFCHENGHLLCRFPDMYDYGERDGDSIQSAGIGAYCLMGSGNHNNLGRTPSPVCGYLRELAGWCDRVVTLNDQSGQISAAHGEYGTVLKYATDKPNEYFIVENRSKLGLDQAIPSSGLALYHCDTLGSNELQEGTATRHYQCALLQADGHFDLEHNVNRGDGGDLYGIVPGIALSHTTTPSTRQWDGSDSQLVVSRVSSAGTTIDFTLGSQASLQNIRGESVPALTIPDNNPAGVSNAITISQPGILQSIKVSVDITHTYIGDLVVELTNPTGVMARLHNRTGASQDNLIVSYDSATVSSLAPFVGKAVQGSWTLTVRDVAGVDVGKLNRWSIDIGIGVSNQVITVSATPALKIPDNNATGVSSQIVVSQSGVIRQAKVSVKITHTYVGDLRVELLAPSGKRAILHSRLGGGQDNLDMNYDTSPGSPINALIGESVQGSWVLRVADLEGQDIGTVDSWALEFVTGS